MGFRRQWLSIQLAIYSSRDALWLVALNDAPMDKTGSGTADMMALEDDGNGPKMIILKLWG